MVVLTGGGTGGHIYPLISIIEELRKRGIDDIAWIGKKGAKEEKLARSLKIPFYGIRAGKLRRYISIKNVLDTINVLLGLFQSIFILRKLRPAILFSKGGFVCVPPAIAAYIMRIPVLTHESDLSPGLATKIISKFAEVVFVSFEETGKYLKAKKVVFSGNPVRSLIKKADPQRGKAFLCFRDDLPIVTVLGGSLGSERINRIVWSMVEKMKPDFNIVHQCGVGKISNRKINSTNYRVFDFINEEIGDVLSCSDIVISRAGAGALYEIAYLGKPSILIPLSKEASRGEQISNAKYFSEKGASIYLDEKNITPEILYSIIKKALADRKRLSKMGKKARELVKSDAEIVIADYILKNEIG